jgi:membrane protease YdiL (CAAX protease family)
VNSNHKGYGISKVLLIFAAASLLLFFETHFVIPRLSNITGLEPVILWFIVAGFGMFLPLLFVSYYLLRREEKKINLNTWKDRLRFKRMTGRDWLWSLAGIILIGLISYLIMSLIESNTEFNRHPPFMSFEPLTPDRYWVMLLWLPYWILNIMGEEILWRGVILTRQEAVSGKYSWIVNAVGWSIFHISFGWQLFITMIPVLFILPYIVQRTGNTWNGVVIHAVINGPSFIAIAFGLL